MALLTDEAKKKELKEVCDVTVQENKSILNIINYNEKKYKETLMMFITCRKYYGSDFKTVNIASCNFHHTVDNFSTLCYNCL